MLYHLCKVQKQVKIINGDINKNNGCIWGIVVAGMGFRRESAGVLAIVLCIFTDVCGSYTDVFIL